MKAFVAVMGLMMVMPLQAEIYKCTVSGQTEFSDEPCAENAQTISIDIQQPDADAIQSQEAITAQFREESRVNQIHSLNKKNTLLENKIEQLQRERIAEIDSLRQRTYTTDDGRMATREQGLFEKMDKVDADYRQRVDQLRQEIKQNQQQRDRLLIQAPATRR